MCGEEGSNNGPYSSYFFFFFFFPFLNFALISEKTNSSFSGPMVWYIIRVTVIIFLFYFILFLYNIMIISLMGIHMFILKMVDFDSVALSQPSILNQPSFYERIIKEKKMLF